MNSLNCYGYKENDRGLVSLKTQFQDEQGAVDKAQDKKIDELAELINEESGETVEKMVEIDYDKLVDLRDTSKLSPGQLYRITDYETTTTQENTRSAGNLFDVIVLALDESILSEDAWAIQSDRDRELQSIQSGSYGEIFIRYPEGDGDFDGEHYYAFKVDNEMWYCYTKSLTEIPTDDNVYVFFNDNDSDVNIKDANNLETYSVYGETINYYTGLHFKNSNLSAWKLKYSLDNINWSSSIGEYIYTDDELWFKFIGTVEIDGTLYNKWHNKDFYYNEDRLNVCLISTSNEIGDYASVFDLTTEEIIEEEYSEIYNYYNSDKGGTGTITFMRDEFNNECFYDFKNIQFLRDTQWFDGHEDWCDDVLGYVPDKDMYFYTFSWSDEYSIIEDLSIVGQTLLSDGDGNYGVHNNKIGNCISSTQTNMSEGNSILPNNIIVNTWSYESGFFYGCNSNILGDNCDYNIFGNDCNNNILGDGCEYNIFGNDCENNIFGNYCNNNSFKSGCYYNNLKKSCYNNTFGDSCYNNTFGDSCGQNTFGDSCGQNTFCDSCYNNTFESNCSINTFGDGCGNNRLGYYCNNNTFGNSCNGIIFGVNNTLLKSFYRYIIIESGNKNINLSCLVTTSISNYFQNVKISSGVNNGSDYKNINSYNVNQNYQTIYYGSDGIKYIDDGGHTINMPIVSKNTTLATIDDITSVEEITWSDLKDLRDDGELVIGKEYRIIDYQTTTIQERTKSAGHAFDIIVTADSENVLNENARACLHEDDDYFSEVNAKLEAWELKYCLDNDSSRFVWADIPINSNNINYVKPNYYDLHQLCQLFMNFLDNTGINYFEDNCGFWLGGQEKNYRYYYFSHDYGESLTQDFYVKLRTNTTYKSNSTIEFSANYDGEQDTCNISIGEINGNMVSEGKGVIYYMKDEWNNECPYDFKNIQFRVYDSEEGEDVWAYTFALHDLTTGDYFDHSLYNYLTDDDGFLEGCNNNIIEECPHNIPINGTSGWPLMLNLNVFFGFCDDISQFSTSMNCSETYGNKLSFGCFGNTFGSNSHNNSFGNCCYNNTFGNNCYQNTFGNNCSNNQFGNNCYNNTFGNNCYQNTFGNNCSNNQFGNNCNYNRFGNNCYQNTFGNNCNYINFGNSVNTTINYVKNIIISNECKNLIIKSTDTAATSQNILQNVIISQGIGGLSGSNRLVIEIPGRNLSYVTHVDKESDGTLKIWNPADTPKFLVLTESEYESISEPDNNIIYIVTEDD